MIYVEAVYWMPGEFVGIEQMEAVCEASGHPIPPHVREMLGEGLILATRVVTLSASDEEVDRFKKINNFVAEQGFPPCLFQRERRFAI